MKQLNIGIIFMTFCYKASKQLNKIVTDDIIDY